MEENVTKIEYSSEQEKTDFEYSFTQEESENQYLSEMMDRLRTERNRRLSETDWIHMPDVTISEDLKNQFVEYRQQLRDVPDKVDEWIQFMVETHNISPMQLDPSIGIEWPIKPS